MLWRHSRSAVADDNPDNRSIFHRGLIGGDLHLGCLAVAIAPELQRIGNEVVDPLGSPGPVPPQPGEVFRHSHRRACLFDLVFELSQRLTHDALALDILGWKFHPLRMREGQDVRHQPVHPLDAADDTPEKVLAFLVEVSSVTVMDQAREVFDGAERLSQVMRDDVEERLEVAVLLLKLLPRTFQLSGPLGHALLQLLVEYADLSLPPLALRNVTPHRSAMNDAALVVAKRGRIQADIDLPAILMFELQFRIMYFAGRLKQKQILMYFFNAIGVIKAGNWASEQILLGIAQRRYHRLVASYDCCCGDIDRDEHIGRVVIQIVILRLLLAEVCFRLLLPHNRRRQGQSRHGGQAHEGLQHEEGFIGGGADKGTGAEAGCSDRNAGQEERRQCHAPGNKTERDPHQARQRQEGQWILSAPELRRANEHGDG